VAGRPRWFGVLAVVMLATASGSVAFFSTRVGQDALIDQQVQQAESFGRTVNDAQYQVLQRAAPYARYFVPGIQLVSQPIIAIIIAGVMFGIFSAGLGGQASLAVFVPLLDENSFPARLLGSIDLFLIWWMISLAIGLGVLYKRRTAPIATTMLVTYGVMGLAIAAVRSALAGV